MQIDHQPVQRVVSPTDQQIESIIFVCRGDSTEKWRHSFSSSANSLFTKNRGIGTIVNDD